MRISIVCGADPCGDKIGRQTCDILADQFSRVKAVVLTAENPDILHVVGGWDANSMKLARHATQCHIPYIHTPLGTLSPWLRPTVGQQRLSSSAHALVASGLMEQKLLLKYNIERLQLILNPVITSLTTQTEMAYAYLTAYERNTSSNDTTIIENIDNKMRLLNEGDENIVAICRYLLYAQYLCQKQNIPLTFLHELTQAMVNADYDEEHFADVLDLMNLYDFTQRLEYVLSQKSTLTEGFMPIPFLNDKEARDMLKIVTNYEKTEL